MRAGDFANAQTRRLNGGVQFAYRALSVSANYNWTGVRRGATSTLAPGAFVFTNPRQLVSVSMEYLVRRNTSVYFTASNLLRQPLVNETYGTDTPAYARVSSDRRDGSQVQIGLKGTF